MPTFYDSQENPHELSIEIGRGGEGTVFVCPADRNLVAKIYHEAIDDAKAAKLRWMADNKDEHLLKIAAWVIDTLHDSPGGKVVGFLMPNVKAKEIHELYALKSRRVHFPHATWKFLLHAASNVARAFYVLHKHGHVMGDVNHGNLVVLADGTVKLIDCDSYSIQTDTMKYPCEVGVATHLAPELQGVDLASVVRETRHDNFGLAVIVFQLLFLGRHPFSGDYLGAEDKSLEDCIRERRFAYGSHTETTMVRQPPGTLSLSDVSSRIALLFELAFLTMERPDPKEWIETIEDLSKNLKECEDDQGHYFYDNLADCPWCKIEAQTGLMLYPGNSLTDGKLNVLTIERLVEKMSESQYLPLQSSQFSPRANPSQKAIETRRKNRIRMIQIVCFHAFVMLIMSLAWGGGLAFFLGILIALGAFAGYNYLQNHKAEIFREDFNKKERAWRYLENEWTSFNNSAVRFADESSRIQKKLSDLKNLQNEKIERKKQLGGEARDYQLRRFLSSFRLDDFEHESILASQREAFKNYKLSTAADIDPMRLKLFSALSSDVKDAVLEWRNDLEKTFEFENEIELPEKAKTCLELEFNDKRRDLETEIERILSGMRSASISLQQTKNELVRDAEDAYRAVVQARRDMLTVTGIAPLVVAIILTTFIVPIFISSMRSSPPPIRDSGSSLTNKNVSVVNGQTTVVRPVSTESDYADHESMSNSEIAQLSEDERKGAAAYFLNSALREVGRDHAYVEGRCRVALRFEKDNSRALQTLGEALYNQEKYVESVQFLNQSLKLDPSNETTRLLVGANHLKRAKYKDAKLIFQEIVNTNPQSFEATYNLAVAHQYSGDFSSGRKYFLTAISLQSSDADSHYGLGLCLFKLGDRQAAIQVYRLLVKINPTKATELENAIGKVPGADTVSSH